MFATGAHRRTLLLWHCTKGVVSSLSSSTSSSRVICSPEWRCPDLDLKVAKVVLSRTWGQEGRSGARHFTRWEEPLFDCTVVFMGLPSSAGGVTLPAASGMGSLDRPASRVLMVLAWLSILFCCNKNGERLLKTQVKTKKESFVYAYQEVNFMRKTGKRLDEIQVFMDPIRE
jgi:hypothetical protein